MKAKIKQLIKQSTHNITDNKGNEWEVVEVSDLENILSEDHDSRDWCECGKCEPMEEHSAYC